MGLPELKKKASDIGIRRGDLLLVALLLALSVVLLCVGGAGKQPAAAVRICVNGEETALLPLDTDRVYEIPGAWGNVIEISGGKARMLCADCPDGSCVRQGFVSRAGECIVCLPARVTVTVVAENSADQLDAVAY